MADAPIPGLPLKAVPDLTDTLAIDDGITKHTTVQALVDLVVLPTGNYALTTGNLSQFAAGCTPAQLAALITAVTGTGSLVFNQAPTISLENGTLLPPAGISAGTGVSGAMTVNVGSAGALVVNGGVLGTPSSGSTINCTQRDQIFLPIVPDATPLSTGVKLTFRMPYTMTLATGSGHTAVRASVTTAQTSGSLLKVNILQDGADIFSGSSHISIDNNEKTSTTAVTAPNVDVATLTDDSEITIDITQVGTGGAGLVVWILGTRV